MAVSPPPASLIGYLSVVVEGSQVVVTWNDDGKGMRLQRSGSPSNRTWEDVPDSETTNRVHLAPANSAAFFRLMKMTPGIDATVAIVQNFPYPEIDIMRQYLSEMGLSSVVFDQEGLSFQDLESFSLVIWDDLGAQWGGLTDHDVGIFKTAFAFGIPLYFVGDDLAFQAINLSTRSLGDWVNLLHLNLGEGGNYSDGNGMVRVINTNHPVINGAYGLVTSYQYWADIDDAQCTGTGEVLLGISGSTDVLLAFEDPVSQVRTVTQNNCLVLDIDLTAGELERLTQVERKKLFQNAVWWLLKW